MLTAVLLRGVLKALGTTDEAGANAAVQPLRDAGIVVGVHVGRSKEFFAEDKARCLEFAAGQILDIVENKKWWAVNSAINAGLSYCDRYG